jgi:hypothetical protein
MITGFEDILVGGSPSLTRYRIRLVAMNNTIELSRSFAGGIEGRGMCSLMSDRYGCLFVVLYDTLNDVSELRRS